MTQAPSALNSRKLPVCWVYSGTIHSIEVNAVLSDLAKGVTADGGNLVVLTPEDMGLPKASNKLSKLIYTRLAGSSVTPGSQFTMQHVAALCAERMRKRSRSGVLLCPTALLVLKQPTCSRLASPQLVASRGYNYLLAHKQHTARSESPLPLHEQRLFKRLHTAPIPAVNPSVWSPCNAISGVKRRTQNNTSHAGSQAGTGKAPVLVLVLPDVNIAAQRPLQQLMHALSDLRQAGTLRPALVVGAAQHPDAVRPLLSAEGTRAHAYMRPVPYKLPSSLDSLSSLIRHTQARHSAAHPAVHAAGSGLQQSHGHGCLPFVPQCVHSCHGFGFVACKLRSHVHTRPTVPPSAAVCLETVYLYLLRNVTCICALLRCPMHRPIYHPNFPVQEPVQNS